jgi:hypothetical protein
MGYQLRMTAEIAEWLGDLRKSDPTAATELGAALLALMDAAAAAATSFVTGTDNQAAGDPRERLDHADQRLLGGLQLMRRKAADAATQRHHAESRLSAEEAAATADTSVVADLEREVAVRRQRAETLSVQNRRLHIAVDLFRTRKEAAKAMWAAAEAQRGIQAAFLMAGIQADASRAEATGSDTAARADEALARADEALARADRLLRSARAAAGLPEPADTDPDGSPVLELHADPLGADIRILFGVEPPGTAVLLAVLEGADAISEHRERAAGLAGELLYEITRDGWSSAGPEGAAAGLEFADTGAFLEKWFPDDASVIAKRAAELASQTSLRSLRGGRDVADLARRTDADADSLRMAERDGLQEASVRDAAAYVRALGGRLELTAVIDGERHALAPSPRS